MKNDNKEDIIEICLLLLKIGNLNEMYRFLYDLATPRELNILSRRWKICKLLAKENMTYREIRSTTGSSIVTIARVARFLKVEPYQGYKKILRKTLNKS